MVKIYIFEVTSTVWDKDRSFFLSMLDSSDIKTLPNRKGKDFVISLIGKILVKQIISHETLGSSEKVCISKSKLGKLVIKKPNDSNLEISISHSGSYLAIGICDSGKIGVDIEFLKNFDFGRVRNCLSVSEEKYIKSGKEAMQKLKNFFEIWTRKESFLKALGVGLQRPLPITQFNPDQTKPSKEVRHNNQKYYLSTLKEEKYVLSVCTSKSAVYDQNYLKFTLNQSWFFSNRTQNDNLRIKLTV